MWRSAILRGAGFPAAKVLGVAAPRTAAAADELLELEDRAEELRTRALDTVDRALDDLRSSGRWDEKKLRKPLLKALYALNKGKLPNRRPVDGSLDEVLDDYAAVLERLEAAAPEIETSYESETLEVSSALEEIAAWDRFREAVTWQNRHAVVTALDSLLSREGPIVRNSQRRQHEEVVANYLQRYCVKNDTVGFFGPVGWARFEPGVEGLEVRDGKGFLERRRVYFENWCVDALAGKLSESPGVRRWLAPRLHPAYHLDGGTLYSPLRRPRRIDDREARLLAACDGRRPACEIAAEIAADPETGAASVEEIYAGLEALRRRRILLWDLSVPLEAHSERHLERALERIGDTSVRRVALSALNELKNARTKVARAAGDARALNRAMSELETTFTRLTGLPAQRNHGQTYAARGLVYEDCRRGTRAAVGPEILERLGPPLTLVLRSAAWAAGEIARRAEARLEEAWEALRRREGTPTVESYRLVGQILPQLFLRRERAPEFSAVAAEFQDRWSRVLELDRQGPERQLDFRCEELAERFDAEFANPAPAWGLTRYFSPDLMIAAEGEEAFERGEFDLVLGEIHSSNTLAWSCFVDQHPAPEELLDFVERDIALAGDRHAAFVLPQLPKQTWTQRLAVALLSPSVYRYEFTDAPRDSQPCQPLPAGEVVVERGPGGGLIARTRDGRLSFPALELLGPHLSQECNDVLGAWIRAGDHVPRIRVGDVIISRERWRFAPEEIEAASVSKPHERFLALRRWARHHGMPRHCFFKVSSERKPCFLDFDSPIYADLFLKMVRSAAETGAGASVSVVEMLPRLDQLWLRDDGPGHHTCEIRTTAYEHTPRQ